jgi:hypothetical protein
VNGGAKARIGEGGESQPHRDAPRMKHERFQCPGGAIENSPAFQRWVNEFKPTSSPEGTMHTLPLCQHNKTKKLI